MEPDLTRSLTLPSAGQTGEGRFISFCEDREGNLWLGTTLRGLYRVRKTDRHDLLAATGLGGSQCLPDL